MIILQIFAALCFAFGLWSFVLWLGSTLSGWKACARHSPDQPTLEVLAKKSFVYARLNHMIGYNGVIVLEATRMGLRIRLLSVVSLFHPPIFIPWNDLQFESNPSDTTISKVLFPSFPVWNKAYPQWRLKFFKKTMEWIVEQKKQCVG